MIVLKQTFKEVKDVRSNPDGTEFAFIIVTNENGGDEYVAYELIADEQGGMAPDVRKGVEAWKAAGGKVTPIIAATIDEVKREAHRRIDTFAPSWKQRNMLAEEQRIQRQKSLLSRTTKEDKAKQETITKAWAYIDDVRTASNKFDTMKEIPADFKDDKYWPKEPQ